MWLWTSVLESRGGGVEKLAEQTPFESGNVEEYLGSWITVIETNCHVISFRLSV
jgi:hypothetical protein